MTNFVSSVEIIGLHGQFDLSCQFHEGVNVVYGKNGTGKTTLLHIIANVLNKNFMRFAALNFRKIEVRFNSGEPLTIELEKIRRGGHYHGHILVNGIRLHKKTFCSRELQRFFGAKPHRIYRDSEVIVEREASTIDEEIANQLPSVDLSAAYFPAFRTAIDAWAVNRDDAGMPFAMRSSRARRQVQTEFARSLFGQFVPNLDYPATSEIEDNIDDQIRTAIAKVSQADRTHFGDVPSKMLEALSQNRVPSQSTESILEDIESLSKRFQEYPIQVESMWDKLSDSVKLVPDDPESQQVTKTVLNVYLEALSEIVHVQEDSFADVERYMNSVNVFLDGKDLQISSLTPANIRTRQRRTPSVVIKYDVDSSPAMSISAALSSGERQIVTLIYAATKLNQQDVILIDEPEISLNVDWQRKLLPEMQRQMPSKQLIVCTHSPLVGAKYRNKMIELRLIATAYPDLVESTFNNDIEHFE